MTIHQRPVAPANAVRLDAVLAALAVPSVKLTAADDSALYSCVADDMSYPLADRWFGGGIISWA